MSEKKIALSLEITEGFKHHRDIFAGCQRYAYEHGWNVRVEPAVDRDLKSGRLKECDGIIARATPEMEAVANSFGIPLVNVWLMSKATELPAVLPDVERSGGIVAEHLLSRGMQQFGFIGYSRFKGQTRLLNGFRQALRANGHQTKALRISHRAMHGTESIWENFFDAVIHWLDDFRPPFALFAGTDILARHIIGFCEMKGFKVPRDVVVASYGNGSTLCELSPPTLTSVDGDNERIGYEAATLLNHLMAGGAAPESPILIPPAGLIARQTTDFYASDDPLVASCLRIIADRLEQPIKVLELARELGVSRRGLERRFLDSIGRNIAKEINRLRVERAKRRLARTEDSIKSIAQECGFSSSNHLCSAFTRITGMTPSQFRAKIE